MHIEAKRFTVGSGPIESASLHGLRQREACTSIGENLPTNNLPQFYNTTGAIALVPPLVTTQDAQCLFSGKFCSFKILLYPGNLHLKTSSRSHMNRLNASALGQNQQLLRTPCHPISDGELDISIVEPREIKRYRSSPGTKIKTRESPEPRQQCEFRR